MFLHTVMCNCFNKPLMNCFVLCSHSLIDTKKYTDRHTQDTHGKTAMLLADFLTLIILWRKQKTKL